MPLQSLCPSCSRSFTRDTDRCPFDGTGLVEIEDEGDDALVGTTLDGRFTVLERLGAGGMGTVYRATQHSVGREVAVKIVRRRHSAEPMAAKRFLREARLASMVSHPNVVTVVEFGQTRDGMLYLCMELLRGRTLKEVLFADGPFPVERAVRVAAQICDALDAAHRIPMVHRDLKPANIMILDEPRGRDFVKVLDFGLAKPLAPNLATSITSGDMAMGTPTYMSPEVAIGKQADPRSDLYALGVIIYHLLAGVPPFQAEAADEMLDKHVNDQAPGIAAVSPTPPVVANVVMRLLEKDPARRYASATVVREALVAAAEEARRRRPR